MNKRIVLGLVIAALLSTSVLTKAAVVQLTSPAQFIYPTTTLDFDDGPDGTVANTRYLAQGVEFSRDDGLDIFLNDSGQDTTSPPNYLATIKPPGSDDSWVMHLNAIFSSPTYEIGAFFGNDQTYGYTQTTLSIFDAGSALIGSVTVPTNNNTIIDQFIGLRSDIPFYSARFDNNGEWLAVCIDDMAFTTPEPATALLLGMGALALIRKQKH